MSSHDRHADRDPGTEESPAFLQRLGALFGSRSADVPVTSTPGLGPLPQPTDDARSSSPPADDPPVEAEEPPAHEIDTRELLMASERTWADSDTQEVQLAPVLSLAVPEWPDDDTAEQPTDTADPAAALSALADLYERAGEGPRAKELFAWVAHHDADYVDAAARAR